MVLYKRSIIRLRCGAIETFKFGSGKMCMKYEKAERK